MIGPMKTAVKRNAPRRYFIYARKSTDEEGKQILSIDTQLDEARELARMERLIVVREFIESMSAKEPGRPVFNMMLDEIERGKANGIVAWHPDRLARNSLDGGKLIYFLDSGLLVDLRFKAFWFENTPQGKFILSIAFGESKYYVDALSENVWRGIRYKLSRGQYPGPPPFGYKNDLRAKTIIVDEEAVPLLRKIFRAFASGRYTLLQLRKKATRWGVRTRKGQPQSVAWYSSLLSDPFFIGWINYDGRYYPASHPPLISKRQFHKVQQELLAQPRIRRQSGNKRFIFLGMLSCVGCGGLLEPHVDQGHLIYRCANSKGDCPGPASFWEEDIAALMWDGMRKASLTDRAAKNMDARTKRVQKRLGASVEEMLEVYKARLAEAEKHLERMGQLRDGPELTREEYVRHREKLVLRRDILIDKVREIEKKGDGYWLDPLVAFIEQARQSHLATLFENLEDVANFFKGIGASLYFADPTKPGPEDAMVIRRIFPPGSKQSGRRGPEPALYIYFPYPWKILAHRPPNAGWKDIWNQLVAYFKDPMHPDYAFDGPDICKKPADWRLSKKGPDKTPPESDLANPEKPMAPTGKSNPKKCHGRQSRSDQ